MPAASSSSSKQAKPAPDIRGFFNKPKASPAQKKLARPTPNSSQSGPSQDLGGVIEISDDDEAKPVAKKPPVKKRPAALALSDSDSDEKAVRKPIAKRRKEVVESSDEEQAPPKKKAAAATTPKTTVKSTPKPAVSTKPKEEPAPKRKRPTALLVSSDEDEEPVPTTKKPAASTTAAKKPAMSKKPTKAKREESDYEDEEEEEDEPKPKRKRAVASSDEEEEEEPKKKKPTKAKPAPKAKEPEASSSAKPAAAKPNWAAMKASKMTAPVAHGSKAVPDGEPDCLAGMAFVFTGELSSFSRDEAADIAKRFGGRVVGQPSGKTDYVVLGDNAGPKKLEAIKKHKLKTLSEDEFLHLIATQKGSGKVDEKTKKKMEKEQQAIRDVAKEMEKTEKKNTGGVDPSMQLWTTRYAPQTLKDVCGNKAPVERLQLWLEEWSKSLQAGFKKPGKNMMNVYRAVLITGPPGIGKTTSAHLCAKLAGYTPIEMNASDSRSKKLVESGMNINNTSLDGFFGEGKKTNDLGVRITDKSCLIMDEVDGMSAGDRGGVGALNALIKKTKIPIICIANDRGAQKLKPLMSTCFNMTFARPQANQVRSRILSIAFKEKMKVPANVIDQLIAGSQSDIRQVLNMLSTWKLSSDTMSFDEGKVLAKMNEKYSVMSPFDITNKILGPYLFSATARETLGDKMELYFQDHSFMPLFIHENYLKTQPAKLRNLEGPDKELRQLQLMDRAASSISDGDLVDSLIHGPEQHWGLMPLHAVCSTVRPASFQYGSSMGWGGPMAMSFPQWLGQNSKQNKLSRQLGEVQIRMRLKVSGDKTEIRQSYIPALVPQLVNPLVDEGLEGIGRVIEMMDEYYLSKDEWETIVELGVGEGDVMKKIASGTKSAFTRRYNASEHPIAVHSTLEAPKKLGAGAGGPAPDIEDAFDMDDVVEDVSEDEKAGDEDGDVTKDKLIKESKKKKAAPAKKTAAKAKK